MGKGRSSRGRRWARITLAAVLQTLLLLSILSSYQPTLRATPTLPYPGSSGPRTHALLFGSSGNIEIDIPKPGIAVRIEIPREFLTPPPGGLQIPENDTSFVTSNIRNDYYYYNLVDESLHWTYDWRGTNSRGEPRPSDGPCYKPNFSFYDANAPYCLEIWNFLNDPHFRQPVPNFDYCAHQNATRWVFRCFPAHRFVLLHNLSSPTLAGLYNFTIFVASHTNRLGYPDFVRAWNTTLFVPVSMAYNAGFIPGSVCDAGSVAVGLSCNTVSGPIRGKGIVYALINGTIVARAYLNQSLCQASGAGCGQFNLTGLEPGSYQIEGSAGVDHGLAYSLTICCSGGPPFPPSTITVPPNGNPGPTTLPLRRSPVVCGTISYENSLGAPINSLSGNLNLIKAFGTNPNYRLNVTVEGTDPLGHVFRFEGTSSNTPTDTFNLTAGDGVKYVGSDPYGTEFAGLPAPEDFGSGGYQITVNVYVSGYVQHGGFPTVQLLQSPGTTTPSCSPSPNQPTAAVTVYSGGMISGTIVFESSPGTPESPHQAAASLPINGTLGKGPQALFGGNVVVEAYDQNGIFRGLTVINGTRRDGTVGYASCHFKDTCATVPFRIIGFTEYYNHSLSGVWGQHDYGLPNGTYSLSVYVRGYELTSTSPALVIIGNGGNATVRVHLTRGGAFEVTVSSFDNRFGTRAPQACLPWRFVNSTIPVRARVYFSGSGGPVGYVEVLMNVTGNSIVTGVLSLSSCAFQVVFAGQNWSLRRIWFYGSLPTHVGNDTYGIESYTLGYVEQSPGGITSSNSLVSFSQAYETLFVGNEVDETVPIFSTPQTLSTTPEYDQAIGEAALSGTLMGAEMANLTAGKGSLNFNIYGFGGMQLNSSRQILCQTNVFLVGLQNICGQGHFFYVAPDGTRDLDYGLDVGNYTAQVPEFGFTTHFMQVLTPPIIAFTDLFLENGVVLQAIQMARVTQGRGAVVAGYTDFPTEVAPLSWAQVQASNATYSNSVSTLDGNYTGVDALFVPGGRYNVTFTDLQYNPQNRTVTLQWGGSYTLTPAQPLCPIDEPTCKGP